MEPETDHYMASDSSSVSSESSSSTSSTSSSDHDHGEETKRKFTKRRSIKLAKLKSLKASKIQPHMDHMSITSPDKRTSPESANDLTRQSGNIPDKSLSRFSRTKLRRSFRRRSSGGTNMMKKSNNTRSKLRESPGELALEAGRSIGVNDSQTQASSVSSDSSLSGCDMSDEGSNNPKNNLASPDSKSVRVIRRTSSLRPVRILTKMSSMNKRPSMKRGSRTRESSLYKATCSSALKDFKVPAHCDHQQGDENEGVLLNSMKVCTYSYCSLHGHRHSNLPPLKRFVSMRRRALKSKNSIKSESQSLKGSMHSGTTKKEHASQSSKARHSRGNVTAPNPDTNRETSCSRDEKPNSEATIQEFIAESNCCNFEKASVDDEASGRSIEDGSSPRSVGGLGVHQPQTADGMQDCTSDVAHGTQIGKQKSGGLWHLIYRHMADTIALEEVASNRKSRTLPSDESSGLYSLEVEDSEGDSQKSDAVKLVQEAFDKILSEIPDDSLDESSNHNNTTEDKDFADADHGEGAEMGSTLSDGKSHEDDLVSREEESLKADNSVDSKSETNVEIKENNNANRQSLKSWSTLKKIVTLRRFVKALEKVRNFNPRKPQFSPMESDPGTEKVQLRPQTAIGRKNSEEWMLDYALQQVVSTLAPVQKRKVALLVQAFESVLPLPEVDNSPSHMLPSSSRENSVRIGTGSQDHKDEIQGQESRFGVILRRTPQKEKSFEESRDQASSLRSDTHTQISSQNADFNCVEVVAANSTSETTDKLLKVDIGAHLGNLIIDKSTRQGDQTDFIIGHLEEDKKKEFGHSSEPTSDKQPPLEGFMVKVEVDHQISEEVRSDHRIPEVCLTSAREIDFGLNGRDKEPVKEFNTDGEKSNEPNSQIGKPVDESSADTKISSTPDFDLPVDSSKGTEQAVVDLRNKFLHRLTPSEDTETISTTGSPSAKQKNTNLWYLIYKHMVTGTAAVLEEADKDENNKSATLDGIDRQNSHQGYNTMHQVDRDVKNDETCCQRIDPQQIEAIRLVEEAIDEIPLPETQDDSPSGNISSVLLKKLGDKGNNNTTIVLADGDLQQSNATTPEQANVSVHEEEKSASNMTNERKPSMQRNWSNLKKLILLQRFVKSLEKVGKFNPKEPRFLPLDPVAEAEKVNLRHQETEDRKHGDEWMLDYALRQVVTRLTPVRKRKVGLLVEAFETVIPAIGT